MTTVYLIRHAEAEGNLYRIAHGQYDGLITDRGYQQLRVLKKRFDNVHIDAVYSSDLFRARTTARAIYEPKGLELHLEPAFREIHMGCWEGRPWQELNTAYEEQMFYFNRQLDKFHVEGSETAQQVLDRYIPALKRVAAENDGKTVAVFSHGAAMRMVLGTLNGLTLSCCRGLYALAVRNEGPAPELFRQVRAVLACNKAERHLRGGAATRRKYSRR